MNSRPTSTSPSGAAAARAHDRQQRAELLHGVGQRFARMLLFAFLIGSVCNIAVLLVPIYSMELYDRVLGTRNLQTLLWLTIGLGIVLAVYGALEYARALLYEAMAGRLARDLGLPTLLASAQAAEGQQAAAPGQALRDLNELRGFLAGNLVTVPLDLVWTPVLVAVMFIFHWGYGFYSVACVLVLFGLNLLAEWLTRRPLEQANEQKIRSFSEIAVAVRNAETVEGLGMVPALSRRWRVSQDAMLDKLWRGTRATRLIGSLIRGGRFLMTAGMVCLGLNLAIDGLVSAGTMIATSIMLTKLLSPFDQLITSWRAWVAAGASWQRLKHLLLDARPARGTFPLPCPEGRLSVERLVYIARGSEQPILRGISFQIEPGEVLGVIGPSGGGKTTLARLIVGINEPTAGGVWLDGNNTWLWERGDFGRHVGYMPQATALLEGTVAENIARLRDADPAEVVAAALRAGIHDTIMRLANGYETRIGEAGFVLSGGQRQRLALARALFGNPKLLVLDEPNSNLDDEGERLLLKAVRAARNEGTSVLMIAHRPSLMAIADKLLVLRDGVIERFGGRENVMRAIQAPNVQLVRGPAEASAPARARLAAT